MAIIGLTLRASKGGTDQSYVLLITFIIGYFILQSENYKHLMDKYIDREVMLQRQAKKDQSTSLEEASEVSLDNEEQNDLIENMSNHSGNTENAGEDGGPEG